MKLADEDRIFTNIGLRSYQHDNMENDDEAKSTGIYDPSRICKFF